MKKVRKQKVGSSECSMDRALSLGSKARDFKDTKVS